MAEDSMEIFASGFGMVFGEVPVTLGTTHGVYTHESTGIRIQIPDTESENWALQADGVWQAAVYMADHLPRPLKGKTVLELGAAAGLPGIVSAFGDREDEPERVVLSDYPDKGILARLEENVEANKRSSRVKMVVEGHAWGSADGLRERFDVVLAADVLWMEDMHEALCETLDRVVAPFGQVHIVAGLHTGRGTITSFFDTAKKHHLEPSEIYQVRINEPGTRHAWRDHVEAGEARGGMPGLAFPVTMGTMECWMGYEERVGGTGRDIPIDPSLLNEVAVVEGSREGGSREGGAEGMADGRWFGGPGVMEVGDGWADGCVQDDHRHRGDPIGLGLGVPPSLEEQEQAALLPPTPPLSLTHPTHPKHDKKKRRRPPKPRDRDRLVPLIDMECSFCSGDRESNRHGVPENMASCAHCGRSGHPSCMEIPQLGDIIRSYPWRCQECKECEICKAKGDDSKMLFCDQCDRGWHCDCLTPPLSRAPRGKWSCPMCHTKEPHAPTPVPPNSSPSKPSNRSRRKDTTKSKSLSNSPVPNKPKRTIPQVLTPETESHEPEERPPSPSPSLASQPPLPPSEPDHESEPEPQAIPFPTISPHTSTSPRHTLRFKRTSTTQQPQSSPTRPIKVRIRLTSKSDNEGPNKGITELDSEPANDPFGGILSAADADTTKTAVGPADKERFEKSRADAEIRIQKLSAAGSSSYFATPSSSTYQLPGFAPPPPIRALRSRASPPPTTPTISTPGGIPPVNILNTSNGLRIKTIRFGQFDIDTWYDAPFPEEFSNIPEGRLWMCEFCLKYMKSGFQAGRHKASLPACMMEQQQVDAVVR
ncbi:MYST (SAS MOZ) family, partial [Rhizoctonia solani]